MAPIGFRIALAVTCCAAPLLTGCAGMNRPYPVKQRFALGVEREQGPAAPVRSDTLRVREFQVTPPYDERTFTYRKSDLEFESDYYREFIASPAVLLTSQAISWLRNARLFAEVLPGRSAADNKLLLETTVGALYGDYRNETAPLAVMELQVFLLAEEAAQTRVVFERTYRREVVLKGPQPADLVAGWNAALGAIFADLESDLRNDAPRSNARVRASRP